MNRRDRHTALAATAACGIMLSAAACSGASHQAHANANATGFNSQGHKTLSCMAHQRTAPAASDRPGPHEDPTAVLAVLRYYTANGNRPYCDGKPATDIDRLWISLYLAGGAAKTNVRQALAHE